MSAAKKAVKSAKPVAANVKGLSQQADKAVAELCPSLLAIEDIGRHMKHCPFEGYTVQQCIASLAANVKAGAALMPIPTEAKAAAEVRALLRDGQSAVDALVEGRELMEDNRGAGVRNCRGAAAFGVAVAALARDAGVAFESAAGALGANPIMFCFYHPDEFEGTCVGDFRRGAPT